MLVNSKHVDSNNAILHRLMGSYVKMMMRFEELDEATRASMLMEFNLEQAAVPYLSPTLSLPGQTAFVTLMQEAISNGNEQTLIASLTDARYWNRTNARGARVNVAAAAERLGLTEFNTWYVRGLAKRLLDEGASECQVYRAALPSSSERSECTQHEGQICSLESIYHGHRARYWPKPGNSTAFSIPSGPNCHHTIRRLK